MDWRRQPGHSETRHPVLRMVSRAAQHLDGKAGMGEFELSASVLASLWLTTPSSPVLARFCPLDHRESEALHGIAGSYGGVNFTNGPVTCASQFPEPILMSAAFSRDLINEVATAISTEARAMNNVGQAGMTFFTPNINLYRDPRWGRGQETPGEDPYLASEYVYALITGLQGGVDDRYLKVVADCKHFAAYDLENWDNVTRFEFNAIVSDQDLQESLLPAFESCIRDAHVGSIMCSYNALNGVPACGNSFLLQDLARDAWGLEGFVVSDCDAVAVIQNPHFYTKTNDDTVALALHAGTDINCEWNENSCRREAPNVTDPRLFVCPSLLSHCSRMLPCCAHQAATTTRRTPCQPWKTRPSTRLTSIRPSCAQSAP